MAAPRPAPEGASTWSGCAGRLLDASFETQSEAWEAGVRDTYRRRGAWRRLGRARNSQHRLHARLHRRPLDVLAAQALADLIPADEADERRTRGDTEPRGDLSLRRAPDLQEADLAGEPLRHRCEPGGERLARLGPRAVEVEDDGQRRPDHLGLPVLLGDLLHVQRRDLQDLRVLVHG